MSSVVMNDKDGRALKLEKVGPTFSSFSQICRQKSPKQKYIMVGAPWWNLFDFFFITVQEHFVYG